MHLMQHLFFFCHPLAIVTLYDHTLLHANTLNHSSVTNKDALSLNVLSHTQCTERHAAELNSLSHLMNNNKVIKLAKLCQNICFVNYPHESS